MVRENLDFSNSGKWVNFDDNLLRIEAISGIEGELRRERGGRVEKGRKNAL